MGGLHYWGTCGCTFTPVPDGPGLVCAEPSGHRGAHHAHGVTWTDPFRPATDPQPVAGPPDDRVMSHASVLRHWALTIVVSSHRDAVLAGASALERLDEVTRAARAFLDAFDHASSHAEVIETAAALEAVLAKEGG